MTPDDPHGTGTAELECLACRNRMHRMCRAITEHVWCECPCGIWPGDGTPDAFWLS